jgi:S-formylglutathione hydrolase FrmB
VATPPPPVLPAANSNGIQSDQLTVPDSSLPFALYDARMTTAKIYQPAGGTPTINPVSVPVTTRILLPNGYQSNPAQPYPVLYLLHGGAADYKQWSDARCDCPLAGGGTQSIKVLDVLNGQFPGIVVMPEGGLGGWYSDWPGRTDGYFAPQWESFHIGQLIPWIDANFNTIHQKSGRMIAGVSMGGLGALRYAGRYPDLFSAVGVFSGGTDIRQSRAQKIIDDAAWGVGAATSTVGKYDGKFRVTPPSGVDPVLYRVETVFGPRANWRAQNPVDLAPDGKYNGYAGKFAMYAGNNNGGGETDINDWNQILHMGLVHQNLNHRFCTGSGDHSFNYWIPDLKDFLSYLTGQPTGCGPAGWQQVVP